jgi:hypothetical protein
LSMQIFNTVSWWVTVICRMSLESHKHAKQTLQFIQDRPDYTKDQVLYRSTIHIPRSTDISRTDLWTDSMDS